MLPLIGKPAPDAVLSNTDGKTTAVIASRQGKPAILVFWATWCPHCYDQLGEINDKISSIEAKGPKVILLDVGETKGVVQKYFQRRQMKLVSFIDEDGVLQEAYRLRGVPTVVLIDSKGIVHKISHTFPSENAFPNYLKRP